jgi:hypothetical protein
MKRDDIAAEIPGKYSQTSCVIFPTPGAVDTRRARVLD